jgi:hypothetical protein
MRINIEDHVHFGVVEVSSSRHLLPQSLSFNIQMHGVVKSSNVAILFSHSNSSASILVQVAAGLVRSCISRKEETGILATQADARTFMNFLPFFLVSCPLFFDPHIQCCGSRSWIRCLFETWIRDLGWVKKQEPDPGSVSGMINPDHISELLLETNF